MLQETTTSKAYTSMEEISEHKFIYYELLKKIVLGISL